MAVEIQFFSVSLQLLLPEKEIYLIYLAEKELRGCVANCLEIFYWEVLQSSLTQWVTDSPSVLELLVAFSE